MLKVRPLVTKTLTGTTHLLLLSLLIVFSGYLTRPITQYQAIEEAEARWNSFDDQVQQPNEIRVLTNSLTSMIEKIRQMTQEFEESQKQRRMLEIKTSGADPSSFHRKHACLHPKPDKGRKKFRRQRCVGGAGKIVQLQYCAQTNRSL